MLRPIGILIGFAIGLSGCGIEKQQTCLNSKIEAARRAVKIMDSLVAIATSNSTNNLSPQTQAKTRNLIAQLKTVNELTCVACFCFEAAFPQPDETADFDMVMEDAAWAACEALAARTDDEAAEALLKLKSRYGTDAGNSLSFNKLISQQRKARGESTDEYLY